jgi:hypothetical protein
MCYSRKMAPTKQRLTLSLCALIAAAACTEFQALPAGSESFEPPAEYQLWWSMTESCSQLRGSLAAIDWSFVPGAAVLPGDDRELGGEWFEQGNRIVLAGGEVADGSLVRHEMLHALVRASNHPRFEFLERCAGIVACSGRCLSDGGAPPIPPNGTPIVSPSVLNIDVEVQPAAPSSANFSGYFTVVVTAHNPSDHAVVVQLPPSGDAGPSISFSFSVRSSSAGTSSSDRAYDSEVTFFTAGETKREAFDLHLGGDREHGGLEPGAYTAAGSFGDFVSRQISFTLSP